VEGLSDLTGDHLFVGKLLSGFLLSLQVLLGFMSLQAECFFFLKALNISVF